MVEKKGMSTFYQLRKIGLPASVDKVKNCYRITSNTTLIGRGQSVDIFLDSNIRKGLISRAHAQIIQKDGTDEENVYEIYDTSLNGTYVNDVRIKGSVILKEGDTVAFGHLRGSLIEPGTLAPQKETEFLFKFEKSLHPEIEEEMVDLTEKELNNSSVFMSPKSPFGENGTSIIGITGDPLSRDLSPPKKKGRYLPSEGIHGEQNFNQGCYVDEEADLKAVVAAATAKIKSNDADTSDDGNFYIDLPSEENEVGALNLGVGQVSHAHNKMLPPYLKKVLYPGSNTTAERHINKNSAVKALKANSKKAVGEKAVNGVIDSESEIESESESEYLEESDSEKSVEIPDDSSDNEYNPKGTKKTTSTIQSRLKISQQKSKKQSKPQDNKNKKSKKSDDFTHDKCDSYNCKVPSGNIKTVTWVQCDDCDAWYHVSCSGLSIADAKKKDTVFHCGCC